MPATRILLAVMLSIGAVAQSGNALEQAASLVRSGKTADAVTVLRKQVAAAPASAQAHAMLGMALLDLLQIGQAAAELERALILEPRRTDAAEALARVRLLEGDSGKAATLLRPLVEARLADDTVRVLYAKSLLGSDDAGGAAAVLDQLIRSGNAEHEVNLLAARSYVVLRQYEKAAVICERAMRGATDSDAVETLYLALPSEVLASRLAARYARVQSTSDAAEEIALARVLSNMDPGRKTSAPTLGKDLLERVVKRDPDNALAWYHYGRGLTRLAGPEAALKAWGKALSAHPDDDLRVRILSNIARRRWSMSDRKSAEEAYRSALALNRGLAVHNAEAAFDYLLFLKAQSRPQEVRSLLLEILTWNPLFAPGRMEMANMFAQRGDWRQVIEEAELGLHIAEDDRGVRRSAHAMLARAYAALDQREKAATHQTWVEQHPQ